MHSLESEKHGNSLPSLLEYYSSSIVEFLQHSSSSSRTSTTSINSEQFASFPDHNANNGFEMTDSDIEDFLVNNKHSEQRTISS